jgi:hypothetical protein
MIFTDEISKTIKDLSVISKEKCELEKAGTMEANQMRSKLF